MGQPRAAARRDHGRCRSGGGARTRGTAYAYDQSPARTTHPALQVLSEARLRELVDAFELKLAAAESKDARSLVR